jgi:hypothetical protein
VIFVLICNTFLKGEKMKKIIMTLLATVLAFAVLPVSSAFAEEARQSFGFNAASIKGFPTGEAFLTGGGAYDPETGFLKTGGGFRCLQDVLQGPLSVSINSDDPGSCLAGNGIRWDAADVSPLLSSFQFKCTGATGEALKTVVTDGNTVVMTADFYRQGDGNEESFTAKMFVSAEDEAPDLPGTQNVWIQGVGCGDAIVNFN